MENGSSANGRIEAPLVVPHPGRLGMPYRNPYPVCETGWGGGPMVVLYITVLARRPDHSELVIEAFQTWLRCAVDRVADLRDLALITGQSINNAQNRQVWHPYYHSSDMRRMKRWLGMMPYSIPWAASYRLADTPPGPGSVMEEECRLL